MINDEKIFALLNNHLSVSVYPDFVPEKKPLPAVSFIHIVQSSDRLLNGNRVGTFDTWRLSVIANTKVELRNLVNELETLDNTKTNEFQRIFILYNSSDAKNLDEKFFRAIVDLQTYEA